MNRQKKRKAGPGAKKPEAAAHYKVAVNCKGCHSEHKGD